MDKITKQNKTARLEKYALDVIVTIIFQSFVLPPQLLTERNYFLI